MLRIRSYLKPYLLMFLASVILLFIQANLDLALPDLLSRIVNNGVQLNGVESPVPEALSQETLDHLTLFLSKEDAAAVRAAYTLVDSSSPDYQDYIEKYPVLADKPVYVLNDLEQEQIERLTKPMAQALVVLSAIEQARDNPQMASQLGGQLGGGAFDLSSLPPGTDLFALLGQLPDTQRDQIAATINERFATLGEDMVRQRAIVRVQTEYKALGMDLGQLQTNYILRTGSIMLLYTLLSVICSVSVGYLSAKIAAGTGRDLRSDIFRKVESFSGVEFDKFPTASLITRSTNDITQLQMVTMFVVRLVFYAPIIGVGGIIRAYGKGSSMWWTIALGVIVLLGVIITLVTIALPKFRIIQTLIDRLNLVARENLSGILVIR
ncbi:MAG: ABC transporter permease, partial [Chloroflexota bacterium]